MSAFNINGTIIAEMDTIKPATPEMFGAVGDGVTDDALAIQSALNAGGYVLFGTGKTYKVQSRLFLREDTVVDFNGATVVHAVHGTSRLFFNFAVDTSTVTGYNGDGNITLKNGTVVGGGFNLAHGYGIRFLNMAFKNSVGAHYFEICACKNVLFESCTFIGMASNVASVKEYINIDSCDYDSFPYAAQDSVFFDGTVNDGLYFRGCLFSVGEDLTYKNGYNAIGVHFSPAGYQHHKNIYVMNNVIEGFSECGFRANQMENVYISGNKIVAGTEGVLVGDKASVDGIVIIDNYIDAPALVTLTSGSYTDLTISGNVAKGENQLT